MPSQDDQSTQDKAQLPWESLDAPDEPTASADGRGDVALLTEAPAEPADAYGADLDAVDYASPVPAEPVEDDLGPPPTGGGWTITMLCLGIGIIACCVIIPQADANRRLAYEREKLKIDLDSIRKQLSTNDEFLRRVADDPNLAERLAQRQMRIIREGSRVLELKKPVTPGSRGAAMGSLMADDVSPFHLVHVAPPPPMPPYQSKGGRLASLCYDPRKRLYLMGAGLLLMAAGLVMGFGPKG